MKHTPEQKAALGNLQGAREYERVRGCLAFTVQGHVRTHSNGKATRYYFADGSWLSIIYTVTGKKPDPVQKTKKAITWGDADSCYAIRSLIHNF